MTTITMYVDNVYPITIGYSGENDVSEVVFNYSTWHTLFGAGNLTLIVVRPGDDEAYAVDLTAGDEDYTSVWTISETDTAYKGTGHAQIMYTVDEQIKKSAIFSLYIDKSITASVNPPDPYQTWLDQMVLTRDEAVASAEDAEAWAVGQRGGVDVESGDETYHNNAKYYSDNAASVLANAAIGVGMTLTTADGILTITEE